MAVKKSRKRLEGEFSKLNTFGCNSFMTITVSTKARSSARNRMSQNQKKNDMIFERSKNPLDVKGLRVSRRTPLVQSQSLIPQ